MATTIIISNLIIISILLLISTAFSERCHPDDKKALLEIKKALNNPPNTVSWDPAADCCDWRIVECDDKTNRITVLVFQLANLSRPVPAAVGDLPYLKTLSFHKTNLTGQIPQAIANLSRLEDLDLSWNHLTGSIPSFLGQLKNLSYINFSFNNLTGSIPPSLSNLSRLSGLLLDRNKLTGPIPDSFADFQQQNFYLYLSHNQLSGRIPAKLGRANFSLFDASRNKLEGDISFLFGKNKSIIAINLSRNMLRFDMSNVEFPMSLTNLYLDHNGITGSLPEGMAEMNLIRLNVSYNRLCGRIPAGGGGRLQELFDYTSFFHNRCLCGAPLPEC